MSVQNQTESAKLENNQGPKMPKKMIFETELWSECPKYK